MSASADKRDPHSSAPRGRRFTLDFEGQPVAAHEGEPVAVALFASGINLLSRSIKFHRPRGFFCLTGDCGACLMRIDGRPNMKACLHPVHEGLRCERQNAWPSAGADLFAAADLLFPEGMDHHTLFTKPRLLNEAMQKVVRQLGGLGRLPDAAVTPAFADLPASVSHHHPVVVVGGGPAGLAAAMEVARALPPESVLLVDAGLRPGGSYLSHPEFGPQAAARALAQAREAGVEVLAPAQAIGWYPEDCHGDRDGGHGSKGLLAVVTATGLHKLTADRTLYATGGYATNALFTDNDRPGVIAGRACGLLLIGHGVLPGERPAVLGQGPYADALCAALAAAGAAVERIDGVREQVVRAHGGAWITGVDVADERGGVHTVPCDLLAVATPAAPASELPRQHGAQVDFSRNGGFGVVVDQDGATQVPGVYAAGDVTGYQGVAEARAHGERVGRALAEDLFSRPGHA